MFLSDVLALSVEKLDEVLEEVDAFLHLDLVHFQEILRRGEKIHQILKVLNSPCEAETFWRAHLTHLQLEESPLLLHLLGDLSSAELGANHAVLLGVLPLLLLDLRSGEVKGRVKSSVKETALRCLQICFSTDLFLLNK